MPQPNKPNYEYRVGFFTLVALIIMLWGWSWLKGFSLHQPQRFTVKFHDVAGLNRNAPVQVNGVRVGTVDKIELHGKGQVLCKLVITTEDTLIPEGSKITIQTLGLVGAKYVEISLPEVDPHEPVPPPIPPDSTVVGEDPVRIELYLNKFATNLSNVSEALGSKSASESLAKAAEASGHAMITFQVAADKFNKNMDRMSEVTGTFNTTAQRFTHGADSASDFFNKGAVTMQKVSGLASDWQTTSRRLNKILDNPSFSGDLKDTAKLAKETAENIRAAVHELNVTLTDKGTRDDITTALNKLANSTDNIYQSMQIVKSVSSDQSLRADIKEMVSTAKSAMVKANDLLGQDNFVTDAKATMAKLRTAADSVDQASKNINQLLGKKHPMLHLIFGGSRTIPAAVPAIPVVPITPVAPNAKEPE